jgi:hypothetical protein
MLGVFVDMSYNLRQGLLSPSWLSGDAERRAKAPNSHTVTQPYIHRSSASGNRLQLSCLKARCAGPPCLALLAGGLGISTEARQPLELKRRARDRIII